MRIVKLSAENVKKLRAVEIVPDGSMVQITGPNGSGKSSVLDSIYWALAGTTDIAAVPVRQGAQKATIRLELGDVTVIRRFTEGGGTSLVVESANGARFPSPQRMLDELLGELTFDPLAFSRMPAKQQLEELRKLVTIDVDLDALDADNMADFAKRTDVNRTVKGLTERMNSLFTRVDPDLPAEPVDVSALLEKMEGASHFNSALERERTNREGWVFTIQKRRENAASMREQAKALLAEADELEATANQEELTLAEKKPLPVPRDTAILRRQIEEARRVNDNCKVREEYNATVASLENAKATAQGLTDRMQSRTDQRRVAITKAKMPVEGLSFDHGAVTYNGLPFDQASSAEQLRISVAIAMAANPKLRVLRIKDGSLLDESNLALIAEMAEVGDYQIWIERVETSGTVGIVMEDGAIVSAAGRSEFPFQPAFEGPSKETLKSRGKENEARAAKVNL